MGYINRTGEFLINPRYKMVGSSLCSPSISLNRELDLGSYGLKRCYDPGFFHEGLAAVSLDGDLFGYIDKKGDFVIPPGFQCCKSFFRGISCCFYRWNVVWLY